MAFGGVSYSLNDYYGIGIEVNRDSNSITLDVYADSSVLPYPPIGTPSKLSPDGKTTLYRCHRFTFNAEAIAGYFNKNELGQSAINIGAVMNTSGQIYDLINLHSMSLATRNYQEAYKWSKIAANFVMPFIDSPMDDVHVKLNVDARYGIWSSVPSVQEDSDFRKGFDDRSVKKYMPQVKVDVKSVNGQVVDLIGQLLDTDGNPLLKQGVKLYFTTTAGSLTKTKYETDQVGSVKLRLITDHLDSGDVCEIGIGFKFLPNLSTTLITV